jgi:hypothetical protein
MTDSSPTTRRVPITDSPWFWVLVFSSAGAICLAVITPQYFARQRRLEMQFLAREEILERQARGDAGARPPGQEGGAAPPAIGELMIPLWPLLGGCVALMLFSTVMLVRSRRPAESREFENSLEGRPRGAP